MNKEREGFDKLSEMVQTPEGRRDLIEGIFIRALRIPSKIFALNQNGINPYAGEDNGGNILDHEWHLPIQGEDEGEPSPANDKFTNDDLIGIEFWPGYHELKGFAINSQRNITKLPSILPRSLKRLALFRTGIQSFPLLPDYLQEIVIWNNIFIPELNWINLVMDDGENNNNNTIVHNNVLGIYDPDRIISIRGIQLDRLKAQVARMHAEPNRNNAHVYFGGKKTRRMKRRVKRSKKTKRASKK